MHNRKTVIVEKRGIKSSAIHSIQSINSSKILIHNNNNNNCIINKIILVFERYSIRYSNVFDDRICSDVIWYIILTLYWYYIDMVGYDMTRYVTIWYVDMILIYWYHIDIIWQDMLRYDIIWYWYDIEMIWYDMLWYHVILIWYDINFRK